MEYTISITNQCNLNCSYCYEKKMHTEYGSMSDETMQRVVNFINQRRDADTIFLFGGEPLLYKDKVRFLCENLNARTLVITTNGTMLDEEFIMWCAERSIVLNMSHDGAKCAERGVDTKLLDEKAKLLVKHQTNTLFQLVYTEETLPYLYDNILHLKNLGAKKVSASLDANANPADIDQFGNIMYEQWRKIARIPNLRILELVQKRDQINGKQSARTAGMKENDRLIAIKIAVFQEVFPCPVCFISFPRRSAISRTFRRGRSTRSGPPRSSRARTRAGRGSC